MNPYGRFGLVSNSASAAILIGGLVGFGRPIEPDSTQVDLPGN